MLSGLQLPCLSDADPDTLAEGSLDPLGTAPIADQLADELAPHVRARMQRIRFVTAIAVASAVCEPLYDVPAADGVTPPYLAFEWHLIEALARDRRLPPEATLRVPGIDKARAVLARGGHLDAGAYLKTPRVFGFHGVYKPLARGVGVVDDELLLLPRGDELLRVWEGEQALLGFADRAPGSEGGGIRRRVEDVVRSALLAGRITESSGSHLWSKLVRALRPDGAGVRERALLWDWLIEPSSEIRRELVLLIRNQPEVESEADALTAIRPHASPALVTRIDAVAAFERYVGLAQAAFDTLRYISTSRGAVPVSTSEVVLHPIFVAASSQVSSSYDQAVTCLAALGLEYRLETELGPFAQSTDTGDFCEALLAHHEHVQARKGKRPWFERDERGFIVRPPYRLGEEPELTGAFLHPYRVFAVQRFLDDLG